VLNGPQWRYVSAAASLCAQDAGDFRGPRLGEPVAHIRRGDGGVQVATTAGEERFDAVVCATHTDQALRMLADADAAERSVLSAIRTRPTKPAAHHPALMRAAPRVVRVELRRRADASATGASRELLITSCSRSGLPTTSSR